MISDAIISVGSLIIPPIFDFIKKKFLNSGKDNPIATMSTLAVSKPDILPQYVEALAKYTESQVNFYNRDVVGQVSKWVSNLRAAIRPIYVVLSLAIVFIELRYKIKLDPAIRYNMEVAIGSWFGSRLNK